MDENAHTSGPTPDEVRNFYCAVSSVYPESDRWHAATHRWVSSFVQREWAVCQASGSGRWLNLGSAGESHGIRERHLLHVDLQPRWFTQAQQYVIADVQSLPFADASFDGCLCVGSVINYCDAARVIGEVARVVRPGGTLVLEFESSGSWELLWQRGFRNYAAVMYTFYQGQSIRLWAYAPEYIRRLLCNNGFSIIRQDYKHCLSTIALLGCRSPNVAARLHVLDNLAARWNWARAGASNVICACVRRL